MATQSFLSGFLRDPRKRIEDAVGKIKIDDLKVNLGKAARVAVNPQPTIQQIQAAIPKVKQSLEATSQNMKAQRQNFGQPIIYGQVESPVARALRVTPVGQKFAQTPVGKVVKTVISPPEEIVKLEQKGLSGQKLTSQEREQFKQFNLVEGLGLALDVPGLSQKVPTAKLAGEAQSVLGKVQAGFEAGRKVKQIENGRPTLQSLRTQLTDRLAPISDFVEKTAKTLGAESNPYKRFRTLAGIGRDIQKKVELGLGPILKKEASRLDDLSSLLVFERSDELLRNGFKTSLKKEEVGKGIQEIIAKHGEAGYKTLQESANQVREYGRGLLSELLDAGVIDQKSFNALEGKGQFYVPFQVVDHIADNLEKGNVARSSFNVASQDVIKAMKGSELAVGDPLEALVERTGKVMSLVERNRAMQSLVNLRKVDNDVFGSLITPIKGTVAKGMDTINVFEDGKNVRYAAPQEVVDAIKGLDKQSSNVLVDLGRWQANVLRAGATALNIGFIPVNIVKDFQDALMSEFSRGGAKAVFDFALSYPAAVGSALKQDEAYNMWVRHGGAQSTFTSQLMSQSTQTVRELAGIKKPLVKRVLGSPKLTLEFINRVAEESTRVNRFKSGLKAGETPLEAAFQSRDITIDFAKSGNAVKLLNTVVPFLNAGVQGTAKMVNLYKKNPKRAAAGAAMFGGFPAILLFNHNRQFEDYKDIPQYEKDENWIILARDRTAVEKLDGEGVVGIKIPKPYFVKPLANTTEGFLDYLNGTNPQSLTAFLANQAAQISPVGIPIGEDGTRKFLSQVTPPVIKAGIESVTNTNLFTGSPIVPQGLEGVDPKEQFKENTPRIYKQLGQLTGQSPLQIENAVNTTTGGVGRQVANLLSGNITEGTVGQITRRFIGVRGGSEVNQEFEEVQRLSRISKTESLIESRKAEEEWARLKDLSKTSKESASAEFKALSKTSPDVAKKVLEVYKDEQMGLTSLDRAVKALPVKDGSRATYIFQKINEAQTKEEKSAIWRDFASKKVLTPEVNNQLKMLVDKQKQDVEAIEKNRQSFVKDRPEQLSESQASEVFDGIKESLARMNPFNPPEANAAELGDLFPSETTTADESGIRTEKIPARLTVGEYISEKFSEFRDSVSTSIKQAVKEFTEGKTTVVGEPMKEVSQVKAEDLKVDIPEQKKEVVKSKEEIKVAPRSTGPGVATKTKYNEAIKESFGDEWVNATRVLSRKVGGRVTGENNDLFGTPEEDPAGLNTDRPNANGSVDRGLFRINDNTFNDFLRRKSELMRKNGITSWDDMLDPVKNTKMAKIIYDEQGWDAWFAAPEDLLSDKEKQRRRQRGLPILSSNISNVRVG